MQLDAQVVGRTHHVLGHRRILTNGVEHGEGAAPVASPQPVGERFGVDLRAEPVEAHQPRLPEELGAGGRGGFAEPVVQILLQRDPERLDLLGDLLAHVEAVGQLPAEDRDDARRPVDLDGVLAAQLRPVDVGLIARSHLHHERAHPAPLGDDIAAGQRLIEIQPGVDLLEQELDVVVGDLGERRIDAGVGRADHRPAAHRDHVEQPLRVVEERQHLVVMRRRQTRHHEVDALRVHDPVLARQTPLAVELVDEGPGRVDDRGGRGGELVAGVDVAQAGHPAVALACRRHQLHVVRRGGAGLDRRPHEREHEARVVVDQDAVVVLDAAAHVRGVDHRLLVFDLRPIEQAGPPRAELADQPVAEGAEAGEPRLVRRCLVEGGVEGDLLDVVGVGLHQPVA